MDINYEALNDFHQTISTKFFSTLAAAPAPQWQRIATQIDSSSARNTYPFLGELGDMREWLGPRIIDQLESHRYSIENRLFEKTMKADKTEIEDDAGGAIAVYSSRAEIFARAVAMQPDQMMFREVVSMNSLNGTHSILSYDGQNFYDTDHPVGSSTMSNDMGGAGTAWYLLDVSKPLKPFIYQNRLDPQFVAKTDLSEERVFTHREFVWGAERRNAGGYGLWQSAVRSKETLNYANLKAAWERMVSFENDEGRPLGMRPTLLVVPTSLEFAAKEMIDFQLLLSGSGAPNPAYKMVPYMVNEWL